MRRHTTAAALALATALGAGVTPAKAQTSYTIYGSSVFIPSSAAFVASGCNPAYIASPSNGIDSRVIDLGSPRVAAQVIPVQWSAVTAVSAALGGGLNLDFYTGGCSKIIPAHQSTGLAAPSGAWPVTFPAGAKYAVFMPTAVANLTLAF
jgi:hypothetical protein